MAEDIQIIGRTPEGRPIVLNPDGSVSTERTITVTDPRINKGRPTNIPTIFGGRSVEPAMAIEIIAQNQGVDPDTNQPLTAFKSLREAEQSAQQRSKDLGKTIDKIMRTRQQERGGRLEGTRIRPGGF